MTLAACASPEGEEASPELEEESYTFFGPMPYRSMMPLNLIFPHPTPEKATVIGEGRNEISWSSQYASILVHEKGTPERLYVDGEFLRTALRWKHGLSDRVEVGLEVPYLHFTSGFMDRFVNKFHSYFGLPSGRRDKYPVNDFRVRYRAPGGVFYTAEEDGMHLGDIPVYVKLGLADPEEDGFGLAARALVELPTGNEKTGFGSGRYDGAAGMLAQYAITPSFAGYLGVDHVLRRDPKDFGDATSANVTHVFMAFEKSFSRTFSMVLQSDYQTKPLEGRELNEFKRAEWSAALGLGCRISRSMEMKFFFSEGLTTDSAPDFSFGLDLNFRF